MSVDLPTPDDSGSATVFPHQIRRQLCSPAPDTVLIANCRAESGPGQRSARLHRSALPSNTTGAAPLRHASAR